MPFLINLIFKLGGYILKNQRREKLLEIINSNSLETQEELINALGECGFEVTQSTVSRDIKQLGLVKVLDRNGRYKYSQRFSPKEQTVTETPVDDDHLLNIFSRSVISVNYAMNDVVIKCYSGMAQSACVALDKLYHDMFLGTLAGDDTVFVITKDEASAEKFAEKLKKIME